MAKKKSELETVTVYEINGRRAIIESVFKSPEETSETIGSKLLKLMKNDIDNNAHIKKK